MVPSFFSAYNIVLENRFANNARHFVKDNKSIGGTYIFDYSTDMTNKPYTLTLRLAGERLTTEARAQLYAEAEKNGISHSQLLFVEDATIEVRRLNETEVMRDWLASTEAQLRQRDDSIHSLEAQLEDYKALTLPSEQISQEIKAQWPEVDKVVLARADSTVFLLVTEHRHNSKDASIQDQDIDRMEKWLSIRIQTPSVKVYLLPAKN